MDIQRLDTGPRMSQAVIHGNTVYLAGQVASDPAADASTQTADILAKIDALLAAAGSSRAQILSATIWLTTMDDFAAMNAVWDAWIVPGHTPARATVESPRLARDGLKVEIGVIAAI